MAKFKMSERINPYQAADTARLGAGTGSANNLTDKEVGKFVKLAGASRYDLCAAGDDIEGFIESVESATQDGYTIGSVRRAKAGERKQVMLDGAQATPGTGTIAVGDYLVVGTVVAKDTALSGAAKVCKATDQTVAKNSPYSWRLVEAASTAVGTVGVMEKV